MLIELLLLQHYGFIVNIDVFLLIFFIYLEFFYLTSTMFHELGHALSARKFDRKCNVIISKRSKHIKINKPKLIKFWSNIFKFIKYETIGVLTKENTDNKVNAITVISGDYSQFSYRQIRIIACAGYIFSLLYAIVVLALGSILLGRWSIYYLFLTIFFIIFISIKPSSGELWNDSRIFRNPSEFKKAMAKGKLKTYCYYKFHEDSVEKILADNCTKENTEKEKS